MRVVPALRLVSAIEEQLAIALGEDGWIPRQATGVAVGEAETAAVSRLRTAVVVELHEPVPHGERRPVADCGDKVDAGELNGSWQRPGSGCAGHAAIIEIEAGFIGVIPRVHRT